MNFSVVFLSFSLTNPSFYGRLFIRTGEATHHKKQGSDLPIEYRGMIPIEKNIHVIDEQGNQYEATYPKRAKGLVKKGRARFVDEHTLCLACPPNEYLEDKTMENRENLTENTVNKETAAVSESTAETESKYNLDYILTQLEKIQQDTEHLQKALNALIDMPQAQVPGDIAGEAKAQSIGDVVRCRETTNQRMIGLYEKMYDELIASKNQPAHRYDKVSELLTKFVEKIDSTGISDETANSYENISDNLRQILREASL